MPIPHNKQWWSPKAKGQWWPPDYLPHWTLSQHSCSHTGDHISTMTDKSLFNRSPDSASIKNKRPRIWEMEECHLWWVKNTQLSSFSIFIYFFYFKKDYKEVDLTFFFFFKSVYKCKYKCIQVFHKLPSTKTNYRSHSNRWIADGHNSIRITSALTTTEH